ncbi:MAG: hypothetical protein CLLPBCKN_003439 [Chroococcidiopsis cubana SAG 39.79]|nr:hypothetical protein [Chroococcidiopsis cubana SAG 39.79]
MTSLPQNTRIVRRVIYATADFEYKNLIHFSETAMQAGAAAIAARYTIVVDVPTIQVGILPQIQNTFANPLYCSLDAIARPQKIRLLQLGESKTLLSAIPKQFCDRSRPKCINQFNRFNCR